VIAAPEILQGDSPMNARKLGAIVLIGAGTLGLAFGTFRYGRETHRASIGPMDIAVTEHRTVNVPVWAGVGAIAVGVVLLLAWRNDKA